MASSFSLYFVFWCRYHHRRHRHHYFYQQAYHQYHPLLFVVEEPPFLIRTSSLVFLVSLVLILSTRQTRCHRNHCQLDNYWQMVCFQLEDQMHYYHHHHPRNLQKNIRIIETRDECEFCSYRNWLVFLFFEEQVFSVHHHHHHRMYSDLSTKNKNMGSSCLIEKRNIRLVSMDSNRF